MTIEFSRRYWIIFAVFLAMQLFAIAVMGIRVGVVRDGWVYLGLFAVQNQLTGLMVGIGLTFSGCFVDALIIGKIWDSLRPSKS
jgi:membrane associated rhomboid family serine protease